MLRAVGLLRDIRAPWGVAVVTVASGLGVHVWSAYLHDTARRLPSSLETLAWVSALVGIGAMIWAMIRGVRRLGARSRGSARGQAAKLESALKLTALVVLHAGLVLATLVAMTASSPSFLGTTRVASLEGPSGDDVYLYEGGLFCHYEIFVREPGSLPLRRIDRLVPQACVADARLAWDEAAGRAVVVGADGQALRPARWEGFYWGPH